jgi:4-carboxymuconolactone decarboxylase
MNRATFALAAPVIFASAFPASAQQAVSPPQSRPASATETGLKEPAATEDRKARAQAILSQMLPADVATSMGSGENTGNFAGEMSRLAFENVYVQLWTRPGITLRDRSMITIAILIAQGNENELGVHVASGLRNGVTVQELEEIIYHATAYAGFPKVAQARAVTEKVLAAELKK